MAPRALLAPCRRSRRDAWFWLAVGALALAWLLFIGLGLVLLWPWIDAWMHMGDGR